METCVICNINLRAKSKRCSFPDCCQSCAHRIRVWGYDGSRMLAEIAKSGHDLTADELWDFCESYYRGISSAPHARASTMKKGLEILGWNGKIVGGRHHSRKSHKAKRLTSCAYARNHYKKDACELCGSTDELYLHHIVPCKWGGIEFFPDELITLCKLCHLKVHKRLTAVLTPEYQIKIYEQHKLEILRLAQSTLIIEGHIL